MLKQTPSQTVGPYFSYGLLPREYGYAHTTVVGNDLLADCAANAGALAIRGRVFDGAGAPVVDALIEIWQPNEYGRFAHGADDRNELALVPGFTGFGRCGTDDDGAFGFTTVKPGSIGPGQAPHINVIVMMRGILSHAFTRIYFADEAEANARDALLATVPAQRRDTLIAEQETTAGSLPVWRFDVHMQGDDETVFFDV